MIEEAAKHLDTPIYINSTPKGIYSFDLSIIDPKWEDKMLKSNTDFGNSEWIKKKVCFLKIEEAKIYK